MKAFIVLAALLAVALATGYSSGGYESYSAPIVAKTINVNTGKSYQYRKQSGW